MLSQPHYNYVTQPHYNYVRDKMFSFYFKVQRGIKFECHGVGRTEAVLENIRDQRHDNKEPDDWLSYVGLKAFIRDLRTILILECSHTLEPFHFYFVFVVEQFQMCECLTYRTVAHQHGLQGSLTVEDMFCRWKLPILWESVNNMGHSKYGLKLNFNAIIMRTMKSLLERDPRRKFAQWQIRNMKRSN